MVAEAVEGEDGAVKEAACHLGNNGKPMQRWVGSSWKRRKLGNN